MKTLGIKEKSVHINLDSHYYGTIAEIGGGQETARHLFQAGGASNTVAKSISAYDKLFSDHFYNDGQPSRYVAQDRLRKMVTYEYNELIKILDKKNDQKFFAFANTVETLNYHKTNNGHGWLGMAVEGNQRYEPNHIYIHVKLLENDTLLQQYTLGTLGVNLIYGGLFMWEDPRKILQGLLDNLDNDRVEVDYVYVEGPDMDWVDNRLLNLMLVRTNMTPAIMFDQEGQVEQPGDMLYRKNALVFRGYFRPINKLGMDFIQDSMEIFERDEDYKPDNTISFCEISLNYLIQDANLDEKDFLHRVDLLNIMGQSVMVSKFNRFFQLVDYFGQFKMIKLRIVVGLPTFEKILDSTYYQDLRGGLLEAMGALFQENVKMYLYPSLDHKTGEVIYPEDIEFTEENNLLWKYLNATRKILILRDISPEHLGITTEHVTRLIETGDEKLCEYIPEEVMEHIAKHHLFGYKGKHC
ncbi:hypothetical protein [Saccharicrinis sp. FJH54]|uniref:hypothetical protein n=1 Tax=Saccharicrinis sp. FJH54 TaxID=3344665 RepID=UPI0035D5038A